MFKKIVCKLVSYSRITCVRFRHVKPLCPYPIDYSKVEKVTICGASNPLGQYLAFLLKNAEIIKEIALHDNKNVRGLALDLEHMSTKVKVRPNSGDYSINNALKHSDIIIITDGYEASLDDENETLKENAEMMYKYAMKIANVCPEALICVVTPPIHMMVQIFSEAMRACNAYDPNKIFGVTALAEMRANSVVADYLSMDPASISVPILGGASSKTILPLLSHAKPYNEFTNAEMVQLVNTITEIPDECKKLHTAAPLSTAYATARFVLRLCAGLCCCDCAIQSAFVRSNVFSQVKYFASVIRTGTQGAVENFGVPKISDKELTLLSQVLDVLEQDSLKANEIFEKIHLNARKAELEEYRKMRSRKPFIIKTPCPPSPPSIPTEVCQKKSREDPCTPSKDKVMSF